MKPSKGDNLVTQGIPNKGKKDTQNTFFLFLFYFILCYLFIIIVFLWVNLINILKAQNEGAPKYNPKGGRKATKGPHQDKPNQTIKSTMVREPHIAKD